MPSAELNVLLGPLSNRVLVISGPTASGKSSLAIALAEHLDVEIISADSAQVYRGMDLGTAKPSDEVQALIPHHLLDIRDPSDTYSAADFRADTIRLVSDIKARGRVPVIVGGTMLYLKALKDGLADLPRADQSLRNEIAQTASQLGWTAIHEELARIDPESAARIKPTDTQRLQRAIEVFRLTGKSLTQLHRQKTEPCPFELLELAIVPPDRADLHRRIENRFAQMIEQGFVQEVALLFEREDLHAQLPAIKSVGYRQVWSYLNGDIGWEVMQASAVAATRQLAKRQYTWLRSWRDLIVLREPDVVQVLKMAHSGIILDQSPVNLRE